MKFRSGTDGRQGAKNAPAAEGNVGTGGLRSMGDEVVHGLGFGGGAGSASRPARRRRRFCPTKPAARDLRRSSDFGGPYAAVPRKCPGRATATARGCCRRWRSIPLLRESGFSPLGIPHQRGFVYTIAVIDRGGEDGRLVIDARNGRIIRFVPAYRHGRAISTT